MKILAKNKKVGFDYEILEKYEAGIELKGFEVKTLKTRGVSLAGSYVVINRNKKNNHLEAFWVNADIKPLQANNLYGNVDTKRERKLLLNRKEIDYLFGKTMEKGLTLMPISVYTKKSFIKMELALVRGKKKYDKRESLKKKDIEKRIKSELKTRG